ncbi:MAG TPA: 3'-5' exonuclease [Gammaproteobacteria bacterium]
MSDRAHSVIVLDFETTGMSPHYGDRVIEVGAVRIEAGEIVARFQGLMNPGIRINSFIESYTGITNAMVADAPPCAEVMSELKPFIGDTPVVAHNSAFDQRFLMAEWQRLKIPCDNPFACSMLTARRIYPEAPNHKLGTLVAYNQLQNDGVFHRALADAEMTALLWLHMLHKIEQNFAVRGMRFSTMQKLAKVSKTSVDKFFAQLA